MAEFKDLIKYLCTEEMAMDNTGTQVMVKGKLGYLIGYDAGLGFSFVSYDTYEKDEFELGIDEIEIVNSNQLKIDIK